MQSHSRYGGVTRLLAVMFSIVMVVPTALAGVDTGESAPVADGPAPGEAFTEGPIPDAGTPNWDDMDAAAEGPSTLCHTAVYNDNSHNPSYRWSAHAHPNFYWGRTCGYNVEHYVVSASWGPYFGTHSTSWHTYAPEGGQYIAVNTLYYEWHRHCWWGCWHKHYFYGGWGYSPAVYIDVSRPNVDISDISAPKVVDGSTTFVTSDSLFQLRASDRYSGVRDVQKAFDGASWTSGTSTKATGLADGAHTLNYRAIDNVGWETRKAFDFILDNTPPAIDIIHPTYNSANVDKYSAETCTDNGNPRVLVGREVAAEIEMPVVPEAPEVPETPVDLPPLPPIPAEVEELVPTVPEVVTEGPAPCDGEVVETAAITADLPALPQEVPPEVGGAAPSEASVDAQDIDFTQPILVTGPVEFVVDIQDATVGTRNVQFLVDGVVYDDQTGGNGEFSYMWDTTTERAGERTFTVRAFDRLGNVDEFTFAVIVATQTQEGAAETVAHTQAEVEADAAQAQADAEAEKARIDGEVDAARDGAIAEGCTAAGPWARFVPQCTDA